MVFLKFSMFIKKAVKEINGRDMHVCTTVAETRLRTVHVRIENTGTGVMNFGRDLN
jgi:hypothetical protein